MDDKDKASIEIARRQFDVISEQARIDVYKNVLEHYKRNPSSPWSGTALVNFEKSLKTFYDSLGLKYDKVFKKTLPPLMQTFYDRAVKELESAGLHNAIIGKPDVKRIQYFLDSTFEQVAMKTQKMSFEHIKQLRGIAADVTRQMSITGGTRREVSKAMLEKALQIPGFEFIDKGGTKWSNKSYFNTLARTELMNAARASYDDKCTEEGFDVMKLTTSGNCCEHCAKWEGKLFSLTGATSGLPTKQDLMDDGVFHPNCTHSYTLVPAYIAEKKYGFKVKNKKDEEREKQEAHEKHLKHRQEQLERAKANRQERIQQAHQHTLEMQEKFDAAVEEYGPSSCKIQEIRFQYIDAINNEAKVSKKPLLTDAEKVKITQDAKKRIKANLQAELQKQIDANIAGRLEADNKPEYNEAFDGIWRNRTVTPRDYDELKDTIQSKIDYYQRHISETHSDLVKKDFSEKLEKLKRFAANGKEYSGILSKLQEAEDNAKIRLEAFNEKIAPRSSKDAFLQKRKDAAKWFTNENGGFHAADAEFGKQKSYKHASKVEKQSGYNYTAGSGYMNRPLSGWKGDWLYDENFVGIGKVDWNNESPYGRRDINALTALISRSDYTFDCWVQRGSNSRQLQFLLGLPANWNARSIEEIKSMLNGKSYVNPAFTSCAVNKDAGFQDEIIYNFYCPKGTKMLYCHPFSYYKGSNEHEVLLQRGIHCKIIKVQKSAGVVYLDVEVHPELGYEL